MGKKTYVAMGYALLFLSLYLFIIDLLSLTSIILSILAILSFLTSMMTGKKMAAYVHDLHLASYRNYTLGPAFFIYLWLIPFVLFLLIYTLAKLMLGYFIKLALFPLGGSYIGLVYNILSLLSFYLIFSGLYSFRDGFITLWGKAAERGVRTGEAVKEFANKSEEMRKHIRNLMK